MSLLIHHDKQWAVPLHLDLSLTCMLLPGHSDSQDFTLKHQTRTGGTAVALGMPRSGSGEEPYIPGTPQASLCRLRGVCTTIPCSFPEWWTKPYLSPLCRGLAFTGWKGRVWMSCTFLWLCCLLRWGMDSLLEPMDSTPLDDWLQTLEPSKNLDGEQKGAQVVSSAKSHWSRVRDGIWPKRVTVMMGFKVVAQEQKKGNGTERKNCRTWVKNLEPKVA